MYLSPSSTVLARTSYAFLALRRGLATSSRDAAVAEWKERLRSLRLVDKDVVDLNRIKGAQVALPPPGREAPFSSGDAIPHGWHLFLFHPLFYESQLRTDGTELGEYAPIIPPAAAGTSERMWASGSLNWSRDNPLRVGDEVEQVTTVESVEEKEGREGRGPMFFVWQRKELRNSRGLALTEKRCHMFREPPKADASTVKKELPKPALKASDFSTTWNPSPVLLFRYSALTYNSHRIHYDRAYCQEMEKRPDLVVHGPMTASKLMYLLNSHLLLENPHAHFENFEYRATSPLYVSRDVAVQGKWIDGDAKKGGVVELWATDDRGVLSMTGKAKISV